jgi:hypothetical protein
MVINRASPSLKNIGGWRVAGAGILASTLERYVDPSDEVSNSTTGMTGTHFAFGSSGGAAGNKNVIEFAPAMRELWGAPFRSNSSLVI